MQIVIDIPEDTYQYYVKLANKGEQLNNLESIILNGTPLPKGHGDLINISDIEWAKHREERNYIDYDVIDWDDIINAPTIIEADKVESEVSNETNN